MKTETTASTVKSKPRRRTGGIVITISTLLAFSYGLQMYAVVPAYSTLTTEFGLSYSQVGLMVSLWFLGYALAHIPAGFAAAAWGLKRVAVWGGIITALSSGLIAMAGSYGFMLTARFIGGLGMSLVVAAIFPLGNYWSKPENGKLVAGILNGIGLTGGSAIGLYVWTVLMEGMGWRSALWVATAVGLVIAIAAAFLIEVPSHMDELEGDEFSWRSTMQVLKSKTMWGIGIVSVAAYGAFFTVSQLGPGFAESEHGFSSTNASLLGLVMLLVGIPGSILGGIFADRAKKFLSTLWVPAAIIVVLLALIPLVNSVVLWVLLSLIGIFGMMYLSPASVSPSEYPEEVSSQDFATALGLVLTLGNLGAVVFPYVYTLGTQLGSSALGWWLIAGLSALSLLGIRMAKESRTPENLKVREGIKERQQSRKDMVSIS
ncbi:MFS transporter [Enteractinococcus helveticum]|nr:MFS transporter [Enteractinococcus helveticum]